MWLRSCNDGLGRCTMACPLARSPSNSGLSQVPFEPHRQIQTGLLLKNVLLLDRGWTVSGRRPIRQSLATRKRGPCLCRPTSSTISTAFRKTSSSTAPSPLGTLARAVSVRRSPTGRAQSAHCRWWHLEDNSSELLRLVGIQGVLVGGGSGYACRTRLPATSGPPRPTHQAVHLRCIADRTGDVMWDSIKALRTRSSQLDRQVPRVRCDQDSCLCLCAGSPSVLSRYIDSKVDAPLPAPPLVPLRSTPLRSHL